MRTRGSVILLIAILVLAMAALAVLLGDLQSQARQDARFADVQRLLHGLGLGPATDLSRCSFSFDPRLGFSCPEDHGPVPCGSWFCPHHACSVFYYPGLPMKEGARDGENP